MNKRRGADRLSRGLAEPRRLPWFLAVPAVPHVRADAEPNAYVDLHTFQTVEAFDELRRTGALEGSPRYWMEGFAEAYRWMKREMDRRLPTSGDGIVWLWAATTRLEHLRSVRRSRGEVLISVRLPREQVLLSHFSDWHCVLNKTPLIPGRRDETFAEWEARFERESDEWWQRAENYSTQPLESWPVTLREELERSWQPILDPTAWLDSYDGKSWTSTTRFVQATAHRIRLDDVTRAVRLV